MSGNLNLLTITSAVVFCVGLVVTRQLDASPDHSPHRRLIFDLCRMGLIWLLGDITVSLSQWVDPSAMGTPANHEPALMATGTLLIFCVRTVSWGGFFFFQWQTMRRTHPWDRQALTERPCDDRH